VQETAGFVVQLMVHHADAQRDLANDQKSIYNPEALANQRNRGNEGGLIHLSPRWVRIAYPSMVVCILAGILFAALARVPTYSAGAGVITIEGIEITAPSPGTMAAINVQPGQPVRTGEELARLLAQDEESALAQADREYRNALATLLFDGADESTKAAVAAAATTRQRALDRLEARVIRAPHDGVVGDIRVRNGAALGVGDHVLTLLHRDAEPTALVFLPGQDRPRLRRGQIIQIDLGGYTKIRERATIVEVGAEVIGPNEARRALGQKNADAVPLTGPVVMVRVKLPTPTFKVGRNTFRYHDGMPLRGEVKVENKAFLVSLIPALERL
jgi:multidrug resistance efflux pump